MHSGALPRLVAVTRPLTHVPDLSELLSYTDSSTPLVWLRDDRGCVAVGETLRLRFRGADRFARASAAWKQLVGSAEVTDPVELPGTGLVAFGTFAFADSSRAESVLIVPRWIIARHRGNAWVTEIRLAHAATATQAHDLPAAHAFTTFAGVTLPVTTRTPSYLAGAAAAVHKIAAGSIEKIVLARQISGTLADGSAADIRVPLQKLAERYTNCWTFAIDGMLGSSPETLVRQTDGAITARVLAGTRARGDSPTADAQARTELLLSSKDQHEHAFAVQSVITALSPYVTQLHTSEEPFALQLPNVWHLATDVGATPSETASSLEVAAALQPTAAVAGTPTSDAIAAIAEIEPFDRGRYAGAVGWINAAGDGEWVLALRSAQLSQPQTGTNSRTLTATAGGGIVAGSEPEHEFAETVSKFRPIVEAFAPEPPR